MIRHRLAALRDELKQCVASLKPSSTACKVMRGRWGGVMDAIQIVDEELLAEEQGGPLVVSKDPWKAYEKTPRADGHVEELHPDQVAWLMKRRGE